MNISKIKRYFDIAKKEALKSKYKFRIGAVIIKNGTIVSRGFNTNKTHPKMIEHNEYATIHAEMSAIINSDTSVDGATMLVCRVNNQNKFLLAKPCASCIRIMKQCKIVQVIYTTDIQDEFGIILL